MASVVVADTTGRSFKMSIDENGFSDIVKKINPKKRTPKIKLSTKNDGSVLGRYNPFTNCITLFLGRWAFRWHNAKEPSHSLYQIKEGFAFTLFHELHHWHTGNRLISWLVVMSLCLFLILLVLVIVFNASFFFWALFIPWGLIISLIFIKSEDTEENAEMFIFEMKNSDLFQEMMRLIEIEIEEQRAV